MFPNFTTNKWRGPLENSSAMRIWECIPKEFCLLYFRSEIYDFVSTLSCRKHCFLMEFIAKKKISSTLLALLATTTTYTHTHISDEQRIFQFYFEELNGLTLMQENNFRRLQKIFSMCRFQFSAHFKWWLNQNCWINVNNTKITRISKVWLTTWTFP